jgi:hypothetical protein
MKFRHRIEEKKSKRVKKIIENLEKIKNGEIFEDFYKLFNASQTDDILNSDNRLIDSITLDRHVLIVVDLEMLNKYKSFNNDFRDFLLKSPQKIRAYNIRKKRAYAMLSRSLSFIEKKKRLENLVDAWFMAPEASIVKHLIMQKILENFFDIP